jgi:DamX protein
MPVSIRSHLSNAPINQTNEYSSVKESATITEISVTARIDFTLRSSNQAILVIADQAHQYSTLARQFLVTLSSESSNEKSKHDKHYGNQCNVAFVSASIKLNDIQMRCRLVEQLFGNTLFDPEQSLAVSVLRLAKQQQEAITIVVEHAHALSLQIKYELTQLVALVKNNHLPINVVMFAQTTAAEEISSNKSIFKNKLAIIDAITGQLCNIESSKFSQKINEPWLKSWQKISLVLLSSLMLVVTGLVFYYFQTDSGSKYLTNSLVADTPPQSNKVILENSSLPKVSTKKSLPHQEESLISSPLNDKSHYIVASVEDVNSALINPEAFNVIEKIKAETNDVLGAILLEKKLPIDHGSELPKVNITSAIENKTTNTTYYSDKLKEYTENNLYNESDIVVVQIAGFSDSKHWQDFLQQYPNESFYSYQRILSEKVFTVVTSKVYPDRFTARKALKNLPSSLLERQLWLKPISTVIAEMNTLTD